MMSKKFDFSPSDFFDFFRALHSGTTTGEGLSLWYPVQGVSGGYDGWRWLVWYLVCTFVLCCTCGLHVLLQKLWQYVQTQKAEATPKPSPLALSPLPLNPHL